MEILAGSKILHFGCSFEQSLTICVTTCGNFCLAWLVWTINLGMLMLTLLFKSFTCVQSVIIKLDIRCFLLLIFLNKSLY